MTDRTNVPASQTSPSPIGAASEAELEDMARAVEDAAFEGLESADVEASLAAVKRQLRARSRSAGSESSLGQDVCVAQGFAYGVVGADLHVFGDGVPVYRLESWRQPPHFDSTWLREQPNRLLDASLAVVPFTDRETEMASLRAWRDSETRLAVTWLHGEGGVGKTRMAVHLAAASAAAGWKVIAADQGDNVPTAGTQDLRLGGVAGVLLIVDYADTWSVTHLTSLMSNSLLHRTDTPTRILMLARGVTTWPAVRAAVGEYGAEASALHLEPIPSSFVQRAAAFATARDAFASLYGIFDPSGIRAPRWLESPRPEAGRPLAVQMAALAAVDAHFRNVTPPQDLTEVTMYLLDRERAHWARQLHTSARQPLPTPPPSRSPADQVVVISEALRTLAVALAELGRFGEGRQALKEAVDLLGPLAASDSATYGRQLRALDELADELQESW
ncbi:hypothetical protein ACFZAD_30725 [Streptomyces iakyrus]|uniref:hypothetical protein n=1 Tax=Streptomyces iakyrus TaxID=68219 RepID=UPI0036E3B171